MKPPSTKSRIKTSARKNLYPIFLSMKPPSTKSRIKTKQKKAKLKTP